MKITKNDKSIKKVAIKSSSRRPQETKAATMSPAGVPLRSVVKSSSKTSDACKYIKSAIDALGPAAIDGDASAKDAIANLSVILLDLKN